MSSNTSAQRQVVERRRRRNPEPNTIETLTYKLTNDDKRSLYEIDVPIESPRLQAHGYDWKLKFYMEGAYDPRGALCMHIFVDLTLEDEGVIVSFKPKSRIRFEACHTSDEALAEETELFQERMYEVEEARYNPNPIRTIKYYVTANKCVVNIVNFEEPARLNCVVNLFDFIDWELLNYEINVDIEFLGLQKQVWFPKKPQREEPVTNETSDATSMGVRFDMHKSVLFLMIKHSYTVGSPDLKWSSCKWDHWSFNWTLDQHKELLVVADRFECNDFKIYVESRIIFHFLTKETALQLLIFANSYSCALLWEAAAKEISDMVKRSEAWARDAESNWFLVELLDDVAPNHMVGIAALRNELEDAGLALDGSRDVLIDRLETHRNKTNDSRDVLVNRLETHRNKKSADEIAIAFAQLYYSTFNSIVGGDEFAIAFTQRYYSTLYSNVDGLSEFFNDKSMMTFQGVKVEGQQAIMQKLKSLGTVGLFQKTTDTKPSVDPKSLLIFVTGTIGKGLDDASDFDEFFHLVSTGAGQYYVQNNIFRSTGVRSPPDDDISLSDDDISLSDDDISL